MLGAAPLATLALGEQVLIKGSFFGAAGSGAAGSVQTNPQSRTSGITGVAGTGGVGFVGLPASAHLSGAAGIGGAGVIHGGAIVATIGAAAGGSPFKAADFSAAMQALLPRGRVWPRDGDAVVTSVLSGLAPSTARNAASATALLVDAFPATTIGLLPEWEQSLGLPDPCAGPSPTLQARRNQVVAMLTGIGGQSVPYIENFAAALGFTVTITKFAPARAGWTRAGQPGGGAAWAHAWQVNAPLNSIQRAQCGIATAGSPLAWWGNAVLECQIRAVAPAHTTVIFAYS